ncbi:MAG: hypothetical protein ACKPKO_17815, partial [Candidatus Fonsibacter sp.]
MAALKANNFPDPEAFLQMHGMTAPENIPIDTKPALKGTEREHALRRLPDLHKRIQPQQNDI